MAAQRAHVRLQRILVLRHVEQALIRNDPLKLRQARIEVIEPHLHRVLPGAR